MVMRSLSTLALVLTLAGCAAEAGPQDVGRAGGLDGEPAGELCLFGQHLDDLLYGGRFDFADAETLTVDSALSGLEEKQLLTGVWDEGLFTLDAVFAQADGGRIRVETLLSRESDHPPFSAYTYTVEGAPRGFVFRAASLDLEARIADGWMQDCVAATAPPPGPCLFGARVEELLYDGTFEEVSVETLTGETELSIALTKHLMTGFRRDRVRTPEEVFARVDGGEVLHTVLQHAAGGHEPFHLYTYGVEELDQGFLFEGEDLGVLARVQGEEIRSCRLFEDRPIGTSP